MSDVRFSDFRQNLAAHLDTVAASRKPLLVTRRGAESAYVISASEFEAMQATIHLLQSPRNAERLLRSVAALDGGDGVEREPTDR